MSKVSVIIPSYNAARYLNESIDSVLAQTYPDVEIIVVDDGSTDNTRQLVETYGGRVRYFYQKNGGISSARNKGICESQGKYIAFLDADDSWLAHKLKTQVSLFEQNPEVHMIFSDAEVFNEKKVLRPSNMPPRHLSYEPESVRYKIANTKFNDGSIFKGNFYKDLVKGNLVTVASVILRKECLEQVGNFNEALSGCEDYELWLRIARERHLLFVNSVTTRYRVREDSISGKVDFRDIFYETINTKILENQFFDCPKPYKNLLKKRILQCYHTAIWGYFNSGDFIKARALCLQSLRFDALQMKLYLHLLASFFPKDLIKTKNFQEPR